MQPLWIFGSLVQDYQAPSNCECIQKGTENQYEDKNVILMIANFKDFDPTLATHDFDVIS